MRIYLDRFSEDELFSDVYPMEKRFNDTVVAIKSKKVSKDSDAIAIASDDVIENENNGETVIDLLDRFGYNPIPLMKKNEFVKNVKAYIARMLKWFPENDKADRIPEFKKGMVQAMNFIAQNEEIEFKDFEVYVGNSFDDNAQYFVSYYDGEDEAPTFLFFLDGCIDQKC